MRGLLLIVLVMGCTSPGTAPRHPCVPHSSGDTVTVGSGCPDTVVVSFP